MPGPPTTTPPTPDEVAALLGRGAYADAARALRRLGQLERAQALYEKVWDFAAAAEVAAERGDRPDLLRLLLESRDLARAAEVGLAIQGGTAVEQARAAEVYEKKRMFAEAAALWEVTGARERARDLYRRAQVPLEAARLDEALGREREAGVTYERFLQSDPDSPDAPRAAAALGRLLGRFGRHEEAARWLQRALATLSPTERTLADATRRQLLVELACLGFRLAAGVVLDELQGAAGVDEARAETVDAFVARHARERERRATAELLAGRYEVVRLIGSGGMGRVYLARDRLSAREVAVKVVAPPVDERARASYDRFLREARIVSALRHPAIVAVRDFHEDLGLLVMELMAGGTLADRLAAALSPTATRAVLRGVLAGLEAAHARGVIHRDIKPANVFFAASGEAKLGDFGVAHLQDLGATQTGGFIGTLAYMSPEQITGAPLTFACDVYALGVTTFQMLTGELPFRGPDFVGQHLGETPPSVSSRRPALGTRFDALVARMLAKDPGERFASLAEVRRALDAIPIDVRPPSRPFASAAGPGASASASSSPTGGGAAGGEGGAAGARAAGDRLAGSDGAAGGGASGGDDGRYLVETELGATATSTLYGGLDQRLGRRVVIERFADGALDGEAGARHLAWLRVMARHGGPHLQRVLRIDVARARAIYEAPVGPPPPAALDRVGAARLAASVLRALAGPHAEGVAHGAVAAALVMEDAGATVRVAGHAPRGAAPRDDLDELLLLLRARTGDPLVDGADALPAFCAAVLADD